MTTVNYKSIKGKADDIIHDVIGVPELMKMKEAEQFNFHLVVEEIVVNVCSYAYTDDGPFTITVDNKDQVISIVFKDSGIPFNPLERPDPDINLPLEDRQIGGLGIFLTKKLMDEVKYENSNGNNVLTITKKIS
jgi:serine/threonine-protein kinase RsbW